MRILVAVALLLSFAACTAPASRGAGAKENGAFDFSTGGTAPERGELYIEGLVTPPPADERSLEERDLERIGRKP